MKSYVIRAGQSYMFMRATPHNMVVTPAVAERDIFFEDRELVEVDTVECRLHFVVGNCHYYANVGNVTVLH